jgi:hypothetical protein
MFEQHQPGVSIGSGRKGDTVTLALLLLLLALVVGGVGLFVEALRWVLIIAIVLLAVGAITGWRGRARV